MIVIKIFIIVSIPLYLDLKDRIIEKRKKIKFEI